MAAKTYREEVAEAKEPKPVPPAGPNIPERIEAMIREIEKLPRSAWTDRAVHCLSEASISIITNENPPEE